MQTKKYTAFNFLVSNEKTDLIKEINDFLKANKIVNRKEQMQDRSNSLIGYASENDLRIALQYKEAFEILYTSKAHQDHIVVPALFLEHYQRTKQNLGTIKKINGEKELLDKLKILLDKIIPFDNKSMGYKYSCDKDGKKHIVSGSNNGTIKIWNLQTGKCLKTLKGHKDSVKN